MATHVSVHSVVRVEVTAVTAETGNHWVTFEAYNRDGEMMSRITLFASQNEPINFEGDINCTL